MERIVEINGDKLRRERQFKKLSRRKLGELIGVSETSIYRWEKGINHPTGENLDNLAKILEVAAEEFIDENSRFWRESPKEEVLEAADRKAADATIDKLKTQIELLTFKLESFQRAVDEDVIVAYMNAPDEIRRAVRLSLGLDEPIQQDISGALDQMRKWVGGSMPPVKDQLEKFKKRKHIPNQEERLARLEASYNEAKISSPHMIEAWEKANKFDKLRWVNFQRKMLGMPDNATLETIESGFDIELYEAFLTLSPQDQCELNDTTMKYMGITEGEGSQKTGKS